MIKLDLLVLGDTGWGDELLVSSIMTVLVSLSSMGLGILFLFLLHGQKYQGIL